ncbi:uncharacterized protein [Heptranchias perlo]|uniref:uncharacterized protein n=1 Tax=Heptranchias perlo TaxID=212740 RepID=UPI0035599C6C
MGSHGALPNTPPLECRHCRELRDEAYHVVPDLTPWARRERQSAEMREELENIKTRVSNAVQAFELASSRLCLERAYQANVEFVEDVIQLDAILSKRETRRKYQQQVSVFIVGYQTTCGQRNHLLSQLSEFFSRQTAMIEEESSSAAEKKEPELEDVAVKVNDALNSAEQGILKLAELNKEINKYISTATMAKEPKGSRKKLERAVNQAKENMVHLRKKLKETQTELESKEKRLNELLKQSESRLRECQFFQCQLDIKKKSIRKLCQENELREELLEQEVKRQADRITDLQSMLGEVQAEKEQMIQQVPQESPQLPGKFPEGVDLSDEEEEEEGRVAERRLVETPGLLEDLIENSRIRMSGIQRDIEGDIAELAQKLEKHQITLQEAQRGLLETQVYQLEKVRKAHSLERRRLQGYHQRQITQLLGPDPENWKELDWFSETDRYSEWPDSEGSSENKEDSLNLETQRNTSRTLTHRESGRLSRTSARETEDIARGKLQQLEREDLKLLAGGVTETRGNSGAQFEPVDENVTSQLGDASVDSEFEPMADGVVPECKPMADCVVSECKPMADCVVSECKPMADRVVSECKPMADRVVSECKPMADCVVSECKPMADCVVSECKPMADRVVSECKPMADCVVSECKPMADRVVSECKPMADCVVSECKPMADRVVSECKPMADRVVSECKPMADRVVSESAESSSSGHAPWHDISGLGVTDADLCDKNTQFPVGDAGESREAGNEHAPISAEGPQQGKGSHPGSSHTEAREAPSSSVVIGSLRIYQTVNQVTEKLRKILLQKEMHALARVLEAPDVCQSEGLLESPEWLPAVTRRCDTLLNGVISVFGALLGVDTSADVLVYEADVMSLASGASDEAATGVRRPTKLSATPHQGQKRQQQDTDRGIDRKLILSREQEEDRLQRLTELKPQQSARCYGPGEDGLPDRTTVFSTRLDLEHNVRALRQGLACGRLPRNTYENVATAMRRYGELQQERLSSPVRSYSRFVRCWEAVKSSCAGESSAPPLLKKMEALQSQRAQRQSNVTAQHSDQRLQLAAVLTTTLEQVEAQSGIFLIKPAVSWKGRLDSMGKIGTSQKHLTKKEQPSRLTSTSPCNPIGLTGPEQVLSQSVRILSRGPSEKLWHVKEAEPPHSARGEIAGQGSLIITPRLLEMDVKGFLFNRHHRPTYDIRKEGMNRGVQKLGAIFHVNKPFSNGIKLSTTD